ncbi:MAG TPA: ATP-dependent DNA helicase Rep, partial [Sulfurivirga caldicuralii]|nr:ATP-dependent DNA helicase Rep [Sulfurivirga caldicuralii]
MLDTLNPQQRAAVEETDRPLLVLAGAGSGKTRVITAKIAHLIQNKGLNPRNIFAVTFTNKAAKEMKARVGTLMADKPPRGLNVSTFHTFGLNFLRREGQTVGLKPNFTIMDTADTQQLIKELLKKHDIDAELLTSLQQQLSSWKNRLITPDQALSRAQSETEQFAAQLYVRYQKQLRAYNAVDFDDLIVLPVQCLQADTEIRLRWQNRVRYLLVDEYQDTNAVQYALVKLLVGPEGRFTVVGDDDQSIYAWRGAEPENMAHLQQDFPHLRVIKLEQNYRSTNRILQAANTLIARNPHVFEKRLWSDMGLGDPIRVIACSDEQTEADRVVAEMQVHKFKHNTRWQDYAILYRSNHQARLIERALREQNIPYVLSGGQSFFDRAEIKDV